MRVLVTGATGFIGTRVAARLRADGHQVIGLSRHPRQAGEIALDFATATRIEDWMPVLDGVDAVVNAVGLFRETRSSRFDDLHVLAPTALFQACVLSGVGRVIQISALGADQRADTAYHLSKREADLFAFTLPLHATVVQPSLVFGPQGASARLFGAWATAPVLMLPGRGGQLIQPIHVDDLVEAIAALLASRAYRGERVALVGPHPLSLRAYLHALRRAYGLSRTLVVAIPTPLMNRLANIARWVPGSLLDADALSMLERGSTASPDATTQLLGRPPRPPEQFVTLADRPAAVLTWGVPVLRWSLALTWIITGILSLGIYPEQDSRQLLARLNLVGGVATFLLYGAAALDLLIGLAIVLPRRVPWLWTLQFTVIVSYTVLITIGLPEYWLHPFGPILKNLPMLAAIAVFGALEDRPRWNT